MIDARELQAILAGWFRGSGTSADPETKAAEVVALFRDAEGAALGALTISPRGAEMAEAVEGEPVREELSAPVPAGARSVDITLELRRRETTEAGVMADDLSLLLERSSTVSTELPISVECLRASGSVERSHLRLSWGARPEGVFVESAPSPSGPWRREALARTVASGRESVSVPIAGEVPARFWRVRAATPLNLK